MPKKNMDFEHPTIFGIEEGVLRATRPMKSQKAVKKKGED